MSALPRTPFTEAEYLGLEGASDRKHEFVAGEIVAMAGGKHRHNALAMRFGIELHRIIGDRPCYPAGSDQRVRAADGEAYFYPDASVFCRDGGREVPTVIVEITSPSTASYDTGVKRPYYMTIPSVAHIVIADPNAVHVEHWYRVDGSWRCDVHADERSVLQVLGGELGLRTLYAGLSEISDEE